MNQEEIQQFLIWLEENIKNARWEDCDESMHFYVGETYVGGWAGDARQFFIKQNDHVAKLLRMMDAANDQY